jgi:hypothetical protein
MASSPTTTNFSSGFLEALRQKQVPPEALLVQIDDLLRNRPEATDIAELSDKVISWIGSVKAVIEAWDKSKASFVLADHHIRSRQFTDQHAAYRELLTLLYQARTSLRLKNMGPLSVPISQGKPFEYFEAVRGIIEAASSELYFVDRYLDAEFAGRFLPLVPKGVQVRLLCGQYVNKLLPAVEMFTAQNGATVSVRSAEFHDRYLFVDRKECYASGASFKDGGKTAPTLVVQITDAFGAVAKEYEDRWAGAKVFR